MEASIVDRTIGSWGSGAVRRFLAELTDLFSSRFAVAPDRVREPAWWDEVGQEPILPETRAHTARTRLEQIEFWESPAASTVVESPEPSAADLRQRGGVEAPVTHEPLSPPNNHDRPSTSPSGVGDARDAQASARPVVAPFRERFSEQSAMAPRVSMARYLRLNGMLKNEEDLRDGMELPRRSFRPRFSFLAERHLPIEPGMRLQERNGFMSRNMI